MKTVPAIRTSEIAVHTYRTLQVVTNRYNDFVCDIVMPGHKVANLVLITVSLFGTIRFFGQVNFFAYCIFPCLGFLGIVFSQVAYQFGAVLNDKAESFRKSWTTRTTDHEEKVRSFRSTTTTLQSKYILRLILSCRDLKIKVRNFYYFDSTTVSTYIGIIVSNTITLLLAF